MAGIHHKEAFNKISKERQNEILEIAIEEFSSKGYKSANINIIAKNAGISIGLMYKYFATKEELFLSAYQEAWLFCRRPLKKFLKAQTNYLKRPNLL